MPLFRSRRAPTIAGAVALLALALQTDAFSPAAISLRHSQRLALAISAGPPFLRTSGPARALPSVRSVQRGGHAGGLRMCMEEETAETEMVNAAEQVYTVYSILQ